MYTCLLACRAMHQACVYVYKVWGERSAGLQRGIRTEMISRTYKEVSEEVVIIHYIVT